MNFYLAILLLFNYVTILATSNSGRFFAGIYSIIIIVIGIVLGYAFIIGFSENKKHKDSENGTVGCLIVGCILAVIGGFIALAKSCS